MRIATWNVNGLRARLEFFKMWLKDRRPDIVGLQELKMTDDQFPHDELESLGYRAVTHGQKAWNGVAVVSRKAVEVTQRGLPGKDDRGARLLTARLDGLSFTTVYCPNGKNLDHDDFPRKLDWFDALAEHFRQTHDPGESAVLCGDFNICPAAIDSWNEASLNGAIFHTDDERRRFQALTDLGLHDLFREKHPDLQAFSWWDYRGGAFHRKQGLRIDMILATRPVLTRVRNVEVDREFRKKQQGLTASDHAPVVADLDTLDHVTTSS